MATIEEKKIENKNVDTDEIGTLASEIKIEKSFAKTDAELEKERYVKLQKFSRDNEVLWGIVYAVEKSVKLKKCLISVMFEGFKITIPDDLYFEPYYNFGTHYEKMSEDEKLEHRVRCAGFQLNAKVCFVLEKVQREKVSSEDFEGQYITSAIGNRKKAMEIIRNIYFFHEGRTVSADKQPREINIGDIIETAHVLQVKEDSVLIEAVGCETRIDAYNLNTDYVDNCNKFVSVGDTIKVRVKKFSLLPDSKLVKLYVTGRLYANNKIITTMHAGDSMLGIVESYNKSNDIYTVALFNTIKAACKGATIANRVPVTIGDRVKVYVVKVNEADCFVSGRITKL